MTTDSIFRKYTDSETFSKIIDHSCITKMWEHSVKNYEGNISIVDNGRQFTYGQLDRQVAEMRRILSENGVKKGSLVGIYIPNSFEFVKAFLAVTTMGAAAVLLPCHLDAVTVLGCSLKFGLSAVIYDDSLKENLKLTKEKNPAISLIEASATCESTAPSVCCAPEELCTVLFTGGTTGKSKGARLSHRAVLAGVKNGCYGISEIFEQKYFLVLPLTHVFGLIRNLLTALYTGSSMFICRNNKDMFRDIAQFKPTVMVLVPALAEMALGLSKQFGRNMLGEELRWIICGAATVAPYLVTEYDKLGILLLPGYGLTESANLVSGNPEAIRKPDSVGLIYPDMDCKIVDGELWLKGVNMMDGYVDGEENSIAYSEDGYFKTGDLARIDDEGFLYITGRIKEIIVLSTGENISPAEIENLFYGIDEIQDCLVYADRTGEGEVLAIEILPRASVLQNANVVDIEAYMKKVTAEINAKLPPFQRISKVVVRSTDFARSPSMKILRNKK